MNYLIESLDTLFFRDGRPFNQGEGGNIEANSSFPPLPQTMVGALKAALAYSQGWQGGRTRFSDALDVALNHIDLRFFGPYVVFNNEVLFPAPASLLLERDEQRRDLRLVRLAPTHTVNTDLGQLRLASPTQAKQHEFNTYLELEGYWLSQAGMEVFLRGETPTLETLEHSKNLWSDENRIGIQRTNRITLDGALYQVRHTRPVEGLGLLVGIEGLKEAWSPRAFSHVGGESRLASFTANALNAKPRAPSLHSHNDTVFYTVTLATPLPMQDLVWKQCGGALHPKLPGVVVGACVGKAIWSGGWDSQRNQALELQPTLPAGSAWFIKAPVDAQTQILEQHFQCLGDMAHLGYGQVLIGTWEES
jgi:CRISPR-associated protein Cmr3